MVVRFVIEKKKQSKKTKYPPALNIAEYDGNEDDDEEEETGSSYYYFDPQRALKKPVKKRPRLSNLEFSSENEDEFISKEKPEERTAKTSIWPVPAKTEKKNELSVQRNTDAPSVSIRLHRKGYEINEVNGWSMPAYGLREDGSAVQGGSRSAPPSDQWAGVPRRGPVPCAGIFIKDAAAASLPLLPYGAASSRRFLAAIDNGLVPEELDFAFKPSLGMTRILLVHIIDLRADTITQHTKQCELPEERFAMHQVQRKKPIAPETKANAITGQKRLQEEFHASARQLMNALSNKVVAHELDSEKTKLRHSDAFEADQVSSHALRLQNKKIMNRASHSAETTAFMTIPLTLDLRPKTHRTISQQRPLSAYRVLQNDTAEKQIHCFINQKEVAGYSSVELAFNSKSSKDDMVPHALDPGLSQLNESIRKESNEQPYASLRLFSTIAPSFKHGGLGADYDYTLPKNWPDFISTKCLPLPSRASKRRLDASTSQEQELSSAAEVQKATKTLDPQQIASFSRQLTAFCDIATTSHHERDEAYHTLAPQKQSSPNQSRLDISFSPSTIPVPIAFSKLFDDEGKITVPPMRLSSFTKEDLEPLTLIKFRRLGDDSTSANKTSTAADDSGKITPISGRNTPTAHLNVGQTLQPTAVPPAAVVVTAPSLNTQYAPIPASVYHQTLPATTPGPTLQQQQQQHYRQQQLLRKQQQQLQQQLPP